MTELCERCQERLGELLQWEIDNPALATLAVDSNLAPLPFLPDASQAEEEVQVELSPEQIRALWQHAQSCDECQNALETLREAHQVLGTLPSQAAPPDLRARIQTQLALSHTPMTIGNTSHLSSPSLLNGVAAIPVAAMPVTAMPVAAAPDATQAGASILPPAPNISTPNISAPNTAAPSASRSRWQERASSVRADESEKMVIQRRVPRAVWAGGGALAAAFCLVLALRTEPTASMAPGAISETQVNADSSRGATTSVMPAPAPKSSKPQTAASEKAVAPGKANKTGKAASGAASATGAPDLAQDPSQDPVQNPTGALPGAPSDVVPLPEPGASGNPVQSNPKSNPKTGASPGDASPGAASVPVPEMPRVPAPKPLPKLEKPAPPKSSTLTKPAPRSPQRSDANRMAEPSPVKPRTSTGGGTNIRRAMSAGPRGEAEAAEAGASIVVQVAPAESVERAAPEPTSASSRVGAPEARTSDANDAPQGAYSGGSSSGSSTSDQAAPPASGARQRPRVRGGAPSEAAPAPSISQETGESGSFSAPAPNPIAPSTTAKSAPAASPVRRATIEIKPRRDVPRADIEVVLADGWQFAPGTQNRGRTSVVWLGSARKGEPIRVEIELQATSPKSSARAARVRLLDTSNKQRREISGADVSIAAR